MTVKTVCDNCTKDIEGDTGIVIEMKNIGASYGGILSKQDLHICTKCITTEGENVAIGEIVSNALVELYIHSSKQK